MCRNQKQLVATTSMVHVKCTVELENNILPMVDCIVVLTHHVALVVLVVVIFSVVTVTKVVTISTRDQQLGKMWNTKVVTKS